MLTCLLLVREYVPSENRKVHCFPVQLTEWLSWPFFSCGVIKIHKGRNRFDLKGPAAHSTGGQCYSDPSSHQPHSKGRELVWVSAGIVRLQSQAGSGSITWGHIRKLSGCIPELLNRKLRMGPSNQCFSLLSWRFLVLDKVWEPLTGSCKLLYWMLSSVYNGSTTQTNRHIFVAHLKVQVGEQAARVGSSVQLFRDSGWWRCCRLYYVTFKAVWRSSQPKEKSMEKGQRDESLGWVQKWDTLLVSIVHWLELSHMDLLACRGGCESSLACAEGKEANVDFGEQLAVSLWTFLRFFLCIILDLFYSRNSFDSLIRAHGLILKMFLNA